MKLVDMLVKETIDNGWSWPVGCNSIAQDEYHGDREGDIYAYVNALNGGNYWFEDNDSGYGKLLFKGYEVAEDASTSLVTREQYEVALTAKNGGWIEWDGGECPVADFLKVEYQLRGGAKGSESAKILEWQHEGGRHDIIAYRLHQPQKAELVSVGLVDKPIDDACRVEEDLNDCVGQAPAPLWNGEGLPPVGCECEYSLNAGITWHACKIGYLVGTQGLVMHCDVFEGVQWVRFDNYEGKLKFRPIRSEAEKKRYEATHAMASAPKPCGHSIHGICCEIYDAIAAGKIPGVKLEGL